MRESMMIDDGDCYYSNVLIEYSVRGIEKS